MYCDRPNREIVQAYSVIFDGYSLQLMKTQTGRMFYPSLHKNIRLWIRAARY